MQNTSVECRLQAIEDRMEIYQVVSGYGYAMDGCNAEAVGSFHAENAVYALSDLGAFCGRAQVAAITRAPGHRGLVAAGCGHISTLPYVILDGDRAVATCHTLLIHNGDAGYVVGRLSASRINLARGAEGTWEITHRQNILLDGAPAGPAMLGRLKATT